MIHEDDLFSLGDPDKGPPVTVRPANAVIASGTRLRRRRRAVRVIGACTVVAGLVGAGLYPRDGRSDGPDVAAADDRSSPAVPAGDWLTSSPPPADCAPGNPDSWQVWIPEEIPAAEVPDEMRVLPTWAPDGEQITAAVGNRWTDPWCADSGPVAEQEPTTSTVIPPQRQTTTWWVTVGDAQAVTRGTVCHLQVDRPREAAAYDMASYGGEIVTVNGQAAAWFPYAPLGVHVLVWEMAPLVRASANCTFYDASGFHGLGLDVALPFAESVVPVPADDPRLPG